MALLRRFLLLAGLLLVAVTGGAGLGHARYDRVFSFGDSLTDTGNSAILPITAGGSFTNPPYGQTHFGRPNGRASDGRLVIDFIVESLGLPPPTPYLAGKTALDFLHGANFAVGGATALEPAFLQSRGITSFVPVSLTNQTSWFNGVLQLLDSTVNGKREIMARSLLYLGEIGFNDYSFVAVFGNDTAGLAQSLVPHIVGAIRSVLTDAIGVGARTMVVAGMIPMGCEPELLAMLPGGAGDYYDLASGCITRFNQLAQLHNRALKRMLCQLRRDHPGTAIHYADLYRPITAVVSSPGKYGFGDMPLAACCGGGGGPYNFNFTFFCGTPAATACADPSRSVSWDGIHYTEAANKFVALAMLRGL
ncbi:GDSL esterase/lipase At1g28600-like [Hordeum vulgare subsp. vulgare]|uniref:GDSL esterase/lipase n=1 Tax=Hordeum vulgare subsp. vulgare TaxID=112509 RepID=A0A8I6YWN1_HORVV|nr:GDSL esterase/lipase At1g28600-like [Hordeum vulgare subsp. vulgare]